MEKLHAHAEDYQIKQEPFYHQIANEIEVFEAAVENRLPILLMSSVDYPKKLSARDKKYQIKLTSCSSHSKIPDSQAIEKQVNQRAGYKFLTCWVQREKKGGGIDIESKTRYMVDDFPDFLIREDWQDSQSKERVSDYIDWVSPALLTLQHLNRIKRLQREKKIFIQAASVLQNHILYPEIIDKKLINAALVQSKLQDANSTLE